MNAKIVLVAVLLGSGAVAWWLSSLDGKEGASAAATARAEPASLSSRVAERDSTSEAVLTAPELESSRNGMFRPGVSPSTPEQPRIDLTAKATQEAASKALKYYLRFHDAMRRSFLAGHTSPFTSAQLRQEFEFEAYVDTDALAAAVDAETAGTQSRLNVLADEYMTILDMACDAALAAGPSEIVDKTGAKLVRRQDGDVHRILVESDGDVYVYRLRVDDPPRLERLRAEAQELIQQRERQTVDILTSITGEAPKRKVIVDPLKKKQG